jgi:GTP-binding protein HflX
VKKRLNGIHGTDNQKTPPVGRAAVVHPSVFGGVDGPRAPEARLEEAVGLTHAIGLDIVVAEVIRLKRVRPATLLTKGTLERFAELADDEHLDLIVIDSALTPVQQRNLENTLKTKVIDRTGLILEIFGARARTYEGRLQVELASLTYQRSRLVRSWTHLERQRGGRGFLGGPGERQIEMDRRIIGQRITKLEKDLLAIRRTRALHRQARQRVPYPVIPLVGYTNAGKSTLFNHLTQAGVVVKDMLFATLDPTLRQIELPNGRNVILGDTVGFISDLPTQLVAAFRATLEDVEQADVIVHVRDASHPDSEPQKDDVVRILAALGIGESVPVIEVMNKIDLLDDEARGILLQRSARTQDCIPISATSGIGCDVLLRMLDRKLSQHEQTFNLVLDATDGAAAAWLYSHGRVLKRVDEGDHSRILVTLNPADKERFEHRFNSNHA